MNNIHSTNHTNADDIVLTQKQLAERLAKRKNKPTSADLQFRFHIPIPTSD